MLGSKTFKGIVRGGKVELTERLDVVDGTEVMVSVPSKAKDASHRAIAFGMFAKPGAKKSTLDDFKEAKKIWEPS